MEVKVIIEYDKADDGNKVTGCDAHLMNMFDGLDLTCEEITQKEVKQKGDTIKYYLREYKYNDFTKESLTAQRNKLSRKISTLKKVALKK